MFSLFVAAVRRLFIISAVGCTRSKEEWNTYRRVSVG